MKKIIFLLSALTFFLSSCKEDIELNLESTVGVLCVNGFLYADCDSNVVLVTETGTASPREISNADVKMFINGTLAEEKTSADSAGRYILRKKFFPGDIVKIEVDYGGKTAYREAQVPEYVKDFEAEVTLERQKTYYDSEWADFDTEDMYQIDLKFTDVSSEKNYYRLYLDEYTYTVKYEHERQRISDTVYIDGHEYISNRDTVIYTQKKIVGDHSYHDYERTIINEAPSLCDEEMTTDNDMIDMSVYNYYRVFNNSRFAGGKCSMRVYDICRDVPEETKYVRSEDDLEYLPEYTYIQYVGIETIDEDAYYFLKTLNGFESGSFDSQELTGAIKMYRNVSGGSGNIIFAARKTKTITVFDGFKPTPVFPDEDDDDDYYYYK
ncbi:MAG: DUF4249 family protein [Bacteroidales bacterium]|nr:DUF4249 family protein [Bacteroidales bacterium]